jgi:hypothetical protein
MHNNFVALNFKTRFTDFITTVTAFCYPFIATNTYFCPNCMGHFVSNLLSRCRLHNRAKLNFAILPNDNNFTNVQR